MRSSIRDFRAASAVLLLACLSAGCVSFGGDAGAIADLGRQVIFPHRVSLDDAASSPYASLGLRVGNSSEVMIILATDSGREQLWVSGTNIGITTSKGRIVRTAGLGHDLGGFVLQREEQPSKDGATVTHWIADFPDMKAYGVPFDCESRPDGEEKIQILGQPINTRRIVEHCRAESVTFIWTFDNTFWVDPDSRFVWRSVQHVHPKLDVLELEILRPPA